MTSSNSTPVWQWSAAKTAVAIRTGQTTLQEITGAHIDRTNVVNPRLNAVVVDLGASAMIAARDADKSVAR